MNPIPPVLLAVGLALAGPTLAQNVTNPVEFAIERKRLPDALAQWSQVTGLQVISQAAVLRDLTASPVVGSYTPMEALRLLLAETPLTFMTVGENMVAIEAIERDVTSRRTPPPLQRLAAAQPVSVAAAAPVAESPPAASNGSNRIQEEVIVTAQKRSERLQDVPASVTALGSQEIDRKGIVGMADYLRTLPSVSQIDTGAGNNSIIMRGVSSSPQNFDRGAKATVGYYLNDIPLAGYTLRGGADIKLVDLARVEVVRGPQGTLYGSGSLGGVVRNVPNAPDLYRFQGNFNAEYSATANSGGDNSSLEAVVNLPLAEGKLAVRAVGYWFDNSGYVENIAGSDPATLARAATYGVSDLARNEDVGSDEYTGGRLAVLFQPTDKFKATLTYLRQDITQDGLPDTEPSRPGTYQQARLQLSEIVGGGGERLEDTLEVSHLGLEYDFGWGSLVSSSAWVQEDYLEKRDIGSFFGGVPVPQRNPGWTEAFIQEVRFSSEFDGPFQALVGLYYEDVDRDFASRNYYGGRIPQLNPFGQLVITDDLTENGIKQKAAFGELSYKWDKLKFTLGARAFSYDDETKVTREQSASSAPTVTTLKGDNDGETYKVNVAYNATSNAMVYAQWSEGFRLGSPVSAANPACDLDGNGIIDGTSIASGPRTLDPDAIDSYELGAKLTLLGGSVVLSTAAYRNDWSGVPLRIVISCGFGVDANAGEARTEGVEFSSEFIATDNLRLSLAGSYGDAELTTNAPAIGGVTGDRLPGSPRYTVSTGAELHFDLLGRESFVRGDYAYMGGFYNNLKQTGVEAGDYGLLNLRGGMIFDRLSVDLFVKNATNSDAVTWSDTVFTGANARLYRLRPRTIGMSARYSF